MRWLRGVWFRLRALLGRRGMERDLDQELAFHVEMEAAKLAARGLSPAAARREALRRFGGVERFRERTRDAWGVRWLDDLRGDAAYGVRQLRRSPGFSVVAVLTLALGIGGTTAIFSAVSGLLLRPLPYTDEDRLVAFWSPFNWREVEFDFVKERVDALYGVAAYSFMSTSFRGDEATSLLLTGVTTAELFDVLGAAPLLGRTFRPGEDRVGAEPVAVLSHAFWQQELGGDPAVVGRRLLLDGAPTTVVGVMPAHFYFPVPDVRIWRPLVMDPETSHYQGNGYLVLVGRLGEDVGEARARAQLDALTAALGERFEYPEAWDKTRGAHFVAMREYLLGSFRPSLLLLLGAMGLLLLMASANVAALLLARAAHRTGEMGIRASLGAGRGRLARQVVTEGLVLGGLAGTVGVATAAGGFRLLLAALPLRDGFADAVALDWQLLWAALGLSACMGALVAVAPMPGLFRRDLRDTIPGERTEGGGNLRAPRLQGALVAVQVLVAVALVAGATLLVRSVAGLQERSSGLDPVGVLAVDLYVGSGDMEGAERRAFFLEAAARVAALPGVGTAALVNRLPVRDGGWQGPVAIEGRPDLEGPRRPNSYWRSATPDYFRTMGIPVVAGRAFTAADDLEGPPVAVVGETFARRMWPGEDALGRRVRLAFEGGDAWVTVVGVVGDVRLTGIRDEIPPVIYRPYLQRGSVGEAEVLAVRSGLEPAALAEMVRRTIREADPRAAVSRLTPMPDVVRHSMAEPLRLRFLLVLLGALAMAIGTVGVYGVVSYAVSRRTREYGIRMALGATPPQLVGLVLRTGMAPVWAGVGLGLLVSLALSRLLAGFLFGVGAADPLSHTTAAALLLGAGALAALVPGWRASAVDPVEALRAD